MAQVAQRIDVRLAKWTLIAALAIALLAGLALPAGSASAHSDYDHSIPAENEVVSESPETVQVYFKEEMRRTGDLPNVFIVNEAGDTVSTESVLDDEDRTHVAVTLPPALPNGQYTVIWHTLSDDDGEEAQGAFYFYVGEGPSDGETAAPTATPPIEQTSTPAPTETPPATADDSDNGVPIWGLIVGIIGAAVVAGGAGLVLGRSSGG